MRGLATGIVVALAALATLPAGAAQTAAVAQGVITETKNPLGWKIETAHSLYQMAVASDGIVVPVFYGPKGDPRITQRPRLKISAQEGSVVREVPYRGGFVEQMPAVEALFADGARDTELVYTSSSVSDDGGYPCLRLDLKDPVDGLTVSAYYRVIPELDIIEKWLVLGNSGRATITLENAQSSSAVLPADDYDLVHLSGMWGHEFMIERTRLTPGIKTLQVRDFVAHNNPPWFAVTPSGRSDEEHGPVWFGTLHYSGNWRLDFEKQFLGSVQILGGINFWDTTRAIRPGEQFVTPRMTLGFAPDGMGGASHRLHDYLRRHVLPAGFREKLRPVLYNSWYATHWAVNEEQQVALARVAKQIGVEMFVIDAGWFKGNVSDRTGLGDWTADRGKFPGGLPPMIRRINALGLDFGLWVEPEMVNLDSDAYRAHPDWVLYYPNRVRHERQSRLMLNLAREDVYQFLLDSLSRLLTENNIRFIKWDRNRPLADAGWPDAPPPMQREVRLRYMDNLYRLIEELRRRFPLVWFEDCASGGGRCDPGLLSRMDQVWTSDNTDPADRLFIQYGFLHAFPANTMVGWVTDQNWSHQDHPTLPFRFQVSMSGVLGVGCDLVHWSDEERKEATQWIALYKQIRPLVQQGVLHRLASPFEGERVALEYVAADRSEAVVFQYNLREYLAGSQPPGRLSSGIALRGLDPQAAYSIGGDWKGVFRGATLMNIGLPWLPRRHFSAATVVLKRVPGEPGG
jgi:alpha-galactosidase